MPKDLRTIRKRKGMSINQLASRSGISIAVLVQYEKREQEIPSTDLRRLAKVLWSRRKRRNLNPSRRRRGTRRSHIC
jgi:transcriptional regulator with XRE-family HTH domain